MYRRLLYTSRAANGISVSDVYDIIRVAHNRNSESGLTGALLFLDGYFIQVLEGSPYAVAERYERIVADERHHDVVLRVDVLCNALLFEHEWMALRDGSEIEPRVFEEHEYEPGLPVDRFDGNRSLAFLLSCFEQSAVA
jgi:hypothetical protein